MKRVISLLAGAVAAISIAPARAADMPQYAPPVYVQPPMLEDFGGWYLRGDIGMTNQQVDKLEQTLFTGATGFAFIDEPAFGSGMLFGLGIGYEYNNWLRFDITGEYRGSSKFTALDRYTSGGTVFTNDYTGQKTEWLFLGNVYADLGTWWCITPFIGVGAGFAHIKVDHFRDNNIIAGGGGYAPEGTSNNFAWALHAGLAYKVSQSFTVEFAYRYLSLGDGQTGDPVNLDGTNSTVGNFFHFKDITSHDLKLGMRWNLGDTGPSAAQQVSYAPPAPVYSAPPQQVLRVPAPAPVYVAPQPQYAPAPVYSQPQYAPPPVYSQPQYQQQPQYAPAPLMRKG